MKIVKKHLQQILHLRLFLKKQLSISSLSETLLSVGILSKGFLNISSVIYNFSENNKKEYLSDWNRLHKASQINDKRKIVLDNKLIFQQFYTNNQFVKPIVALTKGKKLLDYSQKGHEIKGLQEFIEFISQFKYGLIIKPYTGGGGARISKVVLKEKKLVFEGACKNYDDFKKYVLFNKTDFLLTEVIKQTGTIHELYPKTLNTIRILTMIDPVSNKPFVASAVQRIGTDKSEVVDNFTAGGISASINIRTGIIGKGAFAPKNAKSLIWYDKHPDSGKIFNGCNIKNWDQIIEYVLEQAETFFYLPYIGWDIVPMENGFYILEANSNSDVNLLQIHGGLLKSSIVKEFFKHHKVIK